MERDNKGGRMNFNIHYDKETKKHLDKKKLVGYGIALIERGYNKNNPHVIHDADFNPMKMLENYAK